MIEESVRCYPICSVAFFYISSYFLDNVSVSQLQRKKGGNFSAKLFVEIKRIVGVFVSIPNALKVRQNWEGWRGYLRR